MRPLRFSLAISALRLVGLYALHLLGANVIAADVSTTNQATVLVIVGAPGEEEYGKNFEKWAKLWEKASTEAGARFRAIGLATNVGSSDLESVKEFFGEEAKESPAELWVVLLGHGTFDGKEAKFNLRGPDLSASDLETALRPFQRPLAIVDTSSGSGPFVKKLCAPGRVILTATKSGYEQNYARFGQYISEAIADPEADLDKDGQTSLLEAFLTAAHRVAEFYKTEGRLATEHAILDDNGDGLGTPADWFRGIHAVKKPANGASLDGLRAHQFHLIRSAQEQKMSPEVRASRDALEMEIAKLREMKSELPEDQYYERLEPFLLDLAKLYEGTNESSQPVAVPSKNEAQ